MEITSFKAMDEDIFNNKTVLITGGTGFLGRALTERILKGNPKSVRVFSRDEVKHHQFEELFNYDNRLRNFIGDVRDYPRLKRAMEDADYVIHAAALKRIDLLEYNVEECIKTNITGTQNVINACLENNVEKALFVSTDKACAPINTYGACKFVSERVFTESNYSKGAKKTVFTSVRYGNVLQSTGSVIPYFVEKMKNGEKIPLTDERMTRFIISSDQAVDLIFKALKYSRGGEVFVPKIPSFKITTLIDILKEENNAKNGVEIIGIRPGEKIHESLLNFSEIPRTYEFEDMYIITSQIEKYQDKAPTEYMDNGKKLSHKDMECYCSDDALIPKEEVKKVFKDAGIM